MLDLHSPGAYGRAGGGNQEIPQSQKQAVNWISWSINLDNGSGGTPAVWDKARGLWAANGIADFPWLHCHSMGDIQRLVNVATQNGSPAIGLNIEDVYDDHLNLQAVSTYLTKNWGKPVHMATMDWVQNAQGWQYLSWVVAALEISPGEGVFSGGFDPVKLAQCVEHAHSEGLADVTLMLKTKGLSAQTYGDSFKICHSLYTSDDIPPSQAGWADWAPTQTPCLQLRSDVMLSPTAKKKFRTELVAYCNSAEQYDYNWHYAQTRPYTGLGAAPQTFHTDDCSSYCALAFWWAGHHTGHPVADPLNWHYSGYGNTQSAYEYLKAHRVPDTAKFYVGDMAIYGSTSDTVHMMVCTKNGTNATARWSSFGREAGPEARTDIHYHPKPLVGVFRHPALL